MLFHKIGDNACCVVARCAVVYPRRNQGDAPRLQVIAPAVEDVGALARAEIIQLKTIVVLNVIQRDTLRLFLRAEHRLRKADNVHMVGVRHSFLPYFARFLKKSSTYRYIL